MGFSDDQIHNILELKEQLTEEIEKHLEEIEEVRKENEAILLAETQSRKLRKEIYQAKINAEKAALEVKDESVITDTNTVTSNDD